MEHVLTMEMLSAGNPPHIGVQKVGREQEKLARNGASNLTFVVCMALKTIAETQTMRTGPGVTQRIQKKDGSIASILVQVQYSRTTISGTPCTVKSRV